MFKSNGRASSPTSLGSYGVEDDEGFLLQDIDSDTGVVSVVVDIGMLKVQVLQEQDDG